jgi:hypothetical protein
MARFVHPSVPQRMSMRELDEAIERACAMRRSRSSEVLEAARDYVGRGWRPVPLPLTVKSKGKDPDAGKGCYLPNWPTLRITGAQTPLYFSGPVNVGVVLGNGLVDIDLDCPEAIALADKYLLPTNSVFGRVSKPRSHRLYQCDTVAPTRTFRDPITGDMIVELRGDMKDGRPGMQTVMPGAIHVKSGEWIEWEDDGERACVAYADLHRRVVQLAVGVVFTRYYQVAPDDDAQFQQVLAKANSRISNCIAQWRRELDGAPAAKPASKPQQPSSFPGVDAAASLPTENEVARVYTALTYISSTDRNERWLPIGGVTHDLPWPEELRRAVWDKWSKDMDPTNKFDEADQDKAWASFSRDYQGKRATMGSIIRLAREGGWDGHTLKPLPEELRVLVPPPAVAPPPSDAAAALMAAAEQLLGMSFVDRMLLRKKVAADHGVTVGNLDTLVKMLEKSKVADEGGSQQGQALNFAEPEPWHDSVDGNELVRAVGQAIQVNVVLSPLYLFVLSLWVIHTYLLDELKCTPRLIIGAATEGCGKSTLVDVLSYLVWRPLRTVGLTAPALFRAIDKHKCALMLDEASRTFDVEHGAARDLLNLVIAILDAGFQPGRSIIRAVGEENDVHEFFVYAPVCLAVFNKTKLPNTLITRSILIPLKKKLRSEHAVPFSLYHDVERLQQVARMVRRWCDDNRERVRELLLARIERERGDEGTGDDAVLFNRLADKWRPLFAIAEAAGYLPEAQYVATELAKLDAVRSEAENDSLNVALLADCRPIFDKVGDWVSDDQLAIELSAMVGRPWATLGVGLQGITKHRVAKLLSDFGITPQRPRTPEGRHYGYARAQFEEAWARYLVPPDTILDEPLGPQIIPQ